MSVFSEASNVLQNIFAKQKDQSKLMVFLLMERHIQSSNSSQDKVFIPF